MLKRVFSGLSALAVMAMVLPALAQAQMGEAPKSETKKPKPVKKPKIRVKAPRVGVRRSRAKPNVSLEQLDGLGPPSDDRKQHP